MTASHAVRSSQALLVMAKAPRAGAVKTRLHPLLGPDGCARLQSALIDNVLALVAECGLTTYLAFDPPGARTEMSRLAPGATLVPQVGTDLGQRMRYGAETVFAAGHSAVVIMGTDVPTITRCLVTDALIRLDDGADVVLGPAVDGGYYLLALARPHLAIFDIDPGLWGGPRVLTATFDAARGHGLRVSLLPVRRDLDTPADAVALLADPLLPGGVADALPAVLAAPLASGPMAVGA